MKILVLLSCFLVSSFYASAEEEKKRIKDEDVLVVDTVKKDEIKVFKVEVGDRVCVVSVTSGHGFSGSAGSGTAMECFRK